MTPRPPGRLNVAIKEWDSVCRAMLDGQQSVLLRKGGIAEAKRRFVPEHAQFLLFPTFLHQQAEHLRSPFDGWIQPADREPDRLALPGWATVTAVHRVGSAEVLEELSGLTVYRPTLLRMRWEYKPQLPLYVMVLRVYRLLAPPTIDVLPRYGGCRSWVPLIEPVDLGQWVPALSDAEADSAARRSADLLGAPAA